MNPQCLLSITPSQSSGLSCWLLPISFGGCCLHVRTSEAILFARRSTTIYHFDPKTGTTRLQVRWHSCVYTRTVWLKSAEDILHTQERRLGKAVSNVHRMKFQSWPIWTTQPKSCFHWSSSGEKRSILSNEYQMSRRQTETESIGFAWAPRLQA